MTDTYRLGWSRWPRLVRVLAVVAVAVGAVAALLVRSYPANELERGLRAIETPRGMTVERDLVFDEGWVCFDSCSSANRFYVSDLPPDEAAPLLLNALREAGYTAEEMDWCLSACTFGGPEEESCGKVVWQSDVAKGDLGGWVSVGVREDGRYGAELVLVARV